MHHERLLRKLSAVGLSDHTVSWFRSYLQDRFQCVKYNNVLSDCLPINYGVPQGSCFSPLLYNIYINDLLTSLPDENCLAYADDITLVATGKTLVEAREKLQSLVDSAARWAKLNCLSLNLDKCNVMLITPKLRNSNPSDCNITLNERTLNVVNQITILGVIIDNHLSWSAQAEKVLGKVNGRLAVLRRVSSSLNKNTRQQVFKAFVYPHLIHFCQSGATPPLLIMLLLTKN